MLLALVVSEIFKKKHFVAEADMDDSIRRKRLSVSLKKVMVQKADRQVPQTSSVIERCLPG